MMSMAELFYGENEPTWLTGNASHPVSAYNMQPAARDYDIPTTYTGRPQYTTSRYMQPAREYYDMPYTYTDGQYTASRYMQPARDYEIPIYTHQPTGQYAASRSYMPAAAAGDYETVPTYALGAAGDGLQYTASRYMQGPAARDYELPTYEVDRHYTTSRHLQPARDNYELIPAPYGTDHRHYTSSRYVEPARDYETDSHYTVSRYMQPSRDLHQQVRPYTDMHQAQSPYNMQYAPAAARHEVPTTEYTADNNWPRQYSMSSASTSPSSGRTGHQAPLNNQTGAARSQNLLPRLELKVPLCCERCEEKVKESLLDMDGVEGVLCDQSHQRVTITGNVQPQKALRRVKKVKKHSDFWTRESRVQQSGGYKY